MKKYLKLFVTFVMVLSSIVIMSACKPKIEKGYVKTGTIETTIAKGDTLITDNVIAVYTYSDKSVVEVEASKLKFSDFSSEQVGTKKLTITYDNYSFDIDIKIVATEADVNSITTLSSRLLEDYEERKGDQENKQEQFIMQNEPIYVGDDNKFDFRIFATGIDGSGNLQSNITKVRTDIIVKLKNGNSSQLLTDDNLANYVVIDSENTTLDFTEEAVGKDFEVEVSARNVNTLYTSNQTSFTATLRVVDGYNVYNAKDLSVYDNYYTSYDNIRPTNENVNAIILQNDIIITKDDVRQDAFWTNSHPNYSTALTKTDQTVEGTPIDYDGTGIYHRKMRSGETFGMYGNYFKIDVSNFPKMVVEFESASNGVNVENSEYMTAHLCLFYTENISEVTEANKSTLEPSTLIHENIYFYGNGALNNQPTNSGALIASKVDKTNYIAKNNITHNFYIANFIRNNSEIGDKEGYNVIDSCKAYNSYQTLVYSWGCKNLKMIDCEYKYAGGPAMIVDHVKPNEDNGGYPSYIDCINCDIASIVSGKEPWFVTYGASSLVMGLMTADQLYTGLIPNGEGDMISNTLPQNNKTLVTTNIVDGEPVNSVNLMVAMKSGSAQSLTVEKINGYVRMFDTVDDYNAYYGLNGVSKSTTAYGLDFTHGDDTNSIQNKVFGKTTSSNDGILYFESAKSGGYINSDVANNYDASFVKPVTLYTILNTIKHGGTKVDSEVSAFQLKNIDTMKDALKTDLATLKAYDDVASTGAISTAYSYAVAQGLMTANAEDTTDDAKYNRLVSLVDSFVSHAEGNYVNIYLFNGMGAIIQLFPTQTVSTDD